MIGMEVLSIGISTVEVLDLSLFGSTELHLKYLLLYHSFFSHPSHLICQVAVIEVVGVVIQ